MYPIIFSLEIPFLGITLEPRFYGLFYAISVLLGSRIVLSEVVRRRIVLSEDEAMNCTLLIFLAGLLGGRLYEVVMEWPNYYSRQPLWKVLAVWEGGLAVHGAIVLGPLALLLYCRWKRISLPAMLDIATLCIVLGQAIGRWGNFTNGEAGGPVTEFWTGIVFPPGTVIDSYAQGAPVHPTMIYESLGNAVIFALLWKLRLRNFRPGMLGALYLIGYAIVRSALTPLRMDNQFLTLGETVILAPYAISGVMVVAAFVWIFAARLWERDPVLQEPPKKTGKRQAA
jgi:phosphatidylglycerol:prolipoprotein diacylglycerol transferase